MASVELTVLEIETRMKGAEQAIANLQAIKTHSAGADQSMGALAMRIAGFTTVANLAVDVGRKTISMVKDLAVESITLAASFEKSRMTWGVLVGDMDKGTAIFDKLYQFAAKTPMSFQGINQAATTLKGFGVTVDQLIPTMSRLGDIAMGDDAKLQRIALVYGQVIAKGKADTRDLWQFVDAGVPIVEMLAKQLGVTSGEVLEMTADGKVGFEALNGAITAATSAGGQFYDMMDKTAETTSGKWSIAVDNFKQSLAELGNSVLPMVNAALDAYNRRASYKQGNDNAWNFLQSGKGDGEEAVAWLRSELAGIESDIATKNTGNSLGISPAAVLESMKARRDLLAIQLKDAQQMQLEQSRIGGSMGRGGTGGKPSSPPPPPAPGKYIPDNSYGVGGYGDPLGSIGGLPTWIQPDAERLKEEGPSAATLGYTEYYDAIRAARGELEFLDMNQKAAAQSAAEVAAEEEAFARIMASLQQQLQSMGTEMLVDGFMAIGESLAAGADGAKSMEQAMAEMTVQVINQLPMMFVSAGLQLITIGNAPAGLALLALGGITGIGAGAMNYEIAQAKEGPTANAMGGIYSSRSLSAYSGGVYDKPQYFGFAKGGVFGEAGPEAIMPLTRTASGSLGVRAEAARVSVVIENKTGSSVSQRTEETTGANGEKQIRVFLEAAVIGTLASGKADKVMAGRYGAQAVARRRT